MKVKSRNMKLSDYSVSKEKYNELKYFCMQYGEKKRELRNSYRLGDPADNETTWGDKIKSPADGRAAKKVMLQHDLELIEQTAAEADPEISKWLIKNVTEGITFEYMDVPTNRTDFYCSRKYFFYLLSLKR